jgi:16S rRNA (uracil1498-N3)-methyltransferase
MNVFYSKNITGNTHHLSDSESKHAVQVLRMKIGDKAILFDGVGGKYIVEIATAHPRKCELLILEKDYSEHLNFHVHIAIAPTKMNERMEWFLEKATEIGIDEITPVICDRSERRQINMERFEKVLVAAMKQSMNPWLPLLNEPESFINFVKTNNSGYIAHCNKGEKILLKKILNTNKNYTILIGPEGDFTPEEIQLANDNGWQNISLGESRLRTETAGLVACTTINLIHQQ